MSSKNIAIAATVACLAAAALWFVTRDGAEPKKSAPVAVPEKVAKTPVPAPKASASGKRSGGAIEVRYEDDPVGSLRLEGQVITDEETPVAGALVAIDARPPRVAKTAEDGSFFFDKLVARNYEVVAQSEQGAAGPVVARLSETNDPIVLILTPGGTLKVHVTAADGGENISDATVELRGIAERSSAADATGHVVFAQVPVNRYDVVATAAGYAPQRSSVRISRSGAVAEVSLAMKRGAKVGGIVVDAEGGPVEGARVTYQGASDWSVQADPRLDSVLSGSDGRFVIATLPSGSFRFVAKAKGHAVGTSEVTKLDGAAEVTDIRIEMEASATITGRVLSVDGNPVVTARVRVAAKSAGMVRRSGAVRQVYTDDQGTYEIGELRRRDHEVVAMHESASSEIVSADLGVAPHKVTLDLNLSVIGMIAGVVVDSKDEPIAGAQVTVFPDFRKGSGRSASEWRMRGMSTELTDAGGRFRVSGLQPEKDYRVRAIPGSSNNAGRVWLSDGIEARSGDENVRIVLPADGGIRGKVLLANGEAPELFTVSVGWRRGTPFSSKDGSFELSELPPKTFTLVIQGPGIDESRVEDVIVKEGDYADVGTITATKGRTISGTVLDSGGSPAAGATVSAGRVIFGDGSSAKASGGSRNPLARGTKTATSNEDGQFTLYGVVMGDLSMVADHETLGRSMPISVQQSSTSMEGIALQLQKTGALEGIVSKNGSPEEGVVVTATSVKFPGVTFNVSSGSDGSYRFDRLIADTYRVKAMFGANPMSGMSFFAETTSVSIDSTATLNIDFVEGGVAVRVTLSAEKDLGFSRINIVGPDIVATTARELEAVMASSRGFESMGMSIRGRPATSKNVLPGRYQLCAIVYPSEVSGMQGTMAYMQREGDNLPTQCQALEVAEGATEQDVAMTVVVPDFVPEIKL